MMNRRTFLAVCLLPLVFILSAARAQGTVVDSVDEDIVEEETSAAPAITDKAKAPAAPAAKKKKKELDLDALLAGDDDDDLLKEDKSVVKPSAADSASVSDTSSAAVKAGESGADSVARSADGSRRGNADARDKAAASRAGSADHGPAVIEDGRTINFAHNLKEYRSPRFAMLLSLFVPGLGQAYARSYVKAGAFGAAELAAIGVALYFNSAGNAKKKDAYKFADENFDVENLKDYDKRLRDEIVKREIDAGNMADITLPCEFYNKDFYDAAKGKQSVFYESIRDNYFTPGWKDFDPGLDRVFTLAADDRISGTDGAYTLSDPDNPVFFYLLTRVSDKSGKTVKEGPMLGYSAGQAEYNTIMDKSKSCYDAVNYTLYALLLNHIASAIDAGFTARAYNARLLGQESVWNRVSVEQQYVFTGSEVSPGLALRVRF